MKYHQFLHIFPKSALKMKQNKNICVPFSKAGVLTTCCTVSPHNCLHLLLLCFPEQGSALLLEIYLLTKGYFHLLGYPFNADYYMKGYSRTKRDNWD